MKDDEKRLLTELARLPRQRDEFATDVAARLGIPVGRAVYVLEKWSRKGWWDCGVSLRTGWLTDRGRDAASWAAPTEVITVPIAEAARMLRGSDAQESA